MNTFAYKNNKAGKKYIKQLQNEENEIIKTNSEI